MRGAVFTRSSRREVLAHLRATKALHFPVEETVPEGKRHLLLRTALFQVLQLELAGSAAVGSDQFVYWNARDPGRRLAPDVFVRTGEPDRVFDSWKTWESGAPQLAVEIVSESNASEREWQDKLERYQEAGFEEVVRFDPLAAPAERLRVWDRLQGDLVERVVRNDRSPCEALGLWWVVSEEPELGSVLTLSRDEAGLRLLPGPEATGRAQGLRDAAVKLLASGLTREQVASALGLDPSSF
jgi:Uma2 family endonuclease